MIIAIGNDLVDIRRIEKALKQYGTQFEEKIFTAEERKKARGRKKGGIKIVAATYAKRFAAKEACAKALGGRGMAWHDIEVTNLKNGAPALKLSGGALKQLKALTPKGAKARVLVALADEYPFALAHVMITAEYD